MPRRRVLVLAPVSLLILQIVISSLVLTACAFSRQKFAIDPDIDRGSAKGFEKVGGTLDTPDFVLKQDSIGTFNIVLHSRENVSVISTLKLGGSAVDNYSSVATAASDVPYGIVYNIEPDTITLAPNSTATATVKITATSDTVPRRYVLGVNLDLNKGGLTEGRGYSIAFTITTGNRSSTITSACVNRTVTATITSTRTVTVTSSNSTTKTVTTGATPNLSTTTTSTPTMTTVSTTTLTSTVTATSTERSADSSTYAWAVSATVAAVVLTVVLLLQRRRK